MFRSCGYFSSFPCPFFVNGLCERPYCHFRHSRHDIEKAKEGAPSYSNTDETEYSTTTTATTTTTTTTSGSGSQCSSPVNSTPTSAPNTAQASLVGSEDVYFTSEAAENTLPPPPSLSQEQETGSFSLPSLPSFTDNRSQYQVPVAEEPEQYVTASPEKTPGRFAVRYSSGPPTLPTYLPTPKTPSLPAPEPDILSSVGVPAYQPTPKRELKRRHGDNVKGRVKGSNMEYDPVCNYSTGGLTNSSQGSANAEDGGDGLGYQPSRKKARGPGLMNKRNLRLSCESLMEDNPDAAGDDDEEESGDDEMGEGEFSEEEEVSSKKGGSSAKQAEEEEVDASSESFENIGDEDISSDEDDFVSVPEQPVNKSAQDKNILKKKVSDTPKSVSEKKDRRSSCDSKTTLSSEKSKKPSKDKIRKSSGSKLHTHSSTKASGEKSHKSISHKHTTSSSSSGKIIEKDDKVSSRKHSSDHKLKNGTSSSTSAKSSSHTSKHSSSATKSSSSSSKNSSGGSSSKRRSSSEGKDGGARRSSSSTKEKSSSSGSKSGSEKQLKSTSLGKTSSQKQSRSDKHSDTHHKTSSSGTSSRRHSGSDDKVTKHHSSSKSSDSSKKNGSDKSSTKDRSSHSGKSRGVESDRTNTSAQGHKLQRKLSSSPRDSEHHKVHRADSSSHHKTHKISSDSSSKKALERMNSNLFGDDSDEDPERGRGSVNGVKKSKKALENSDHDNEDFAFQEGSSSEWVDESGVIKPSMSTAADEEEEDIDYSQFIHDSDFEDDDTFDECLKIFKEEAAKKKISTNSKPEKKLVKDLKAGGSASAPGKKRTAHKSSGLQGRKPPPKKERPHNVLSPSEVMHNRILDMQRRALESAAKQAVQEQEVSSTSGLRAPGLQQGGQKKRVAHEPKPLAPPIGPNRNKPPPTKPEVKTAAGKTDGKRVAHVPNLPALKRPVLPACFGSKVPSIVRQRYLNLIIDECLKFCSGEEEAYKKGLEEETGVYERASNKNIYLRVAVNTITRLRAEAKEALPGSSKSQGGIKGRRTSLLAQSHEATLGGSRAAKTSFTLHRSSGTNKKGEVVLTGTELFQKLMPFTLKDQELIDNCYPRQSPDAPGKAVVTSSRYHTTDVLLKSNERTCSRCGKRFIVNSDGTYALTDECVYHWSRAYPRKKSGFIQHIHNCCSSDTSSKGCQVASAHVHDQNKRDSLSGFMSTMPCSPPRDGNFGIFALDCEMVYTLGGLELARVTVVNTEGDSVFESLVQPPNPVVDYNTRFSGISAADLQEVDTTLTDVQAVLLNLFSAGTILMGHSLESDLFALKLIHSTVVDTSVVFPHRLGPPYKRALKNLMLETFQKIIQSDEGGHDSKEDAVSCLQLMKWRINEDIKREQRYS